MDNNNKDNGKFGIDQEHAGDENFTIRDPKLAEEETNDFLPFVEGEEMSLPAVSLPGVIVFPFALTPVTVEDSSVIRPLENSLSDDRLVAIFPRMAPDEEWATLEVGGKNCNQRFLGDSPIAEIGTSCRIVKTLRFPDGTIRLLVRGVARVRFLGVEPGNPSMTRVRVLETAPDKSLEATALIRNAEKQFQEIVNFTSNFPEELKLAVLNMTDGVRITDLMADTLNLSYVEKLSILEFPSLLERLHFLTVILNREVEVLRLGNEIQQEVHNAMSRNQRDFFLREQLRTVREQLGEGSGNSDVDALRKRLEGKDLPEEAKTIVKRELDRMEQMPPSMPEYNIAYTYMDWFASLPWNEFTQDTLDVKTALEILDRDHFGLKDVKERILEFLSVLQLKKDRKAPIICFVGPPGVGKTSLGKSIAEAMGRKFVRISLGGVRDEAEIRGHRRTYIGALPGRLIQGMKKAGSSNPVFMLDEIDKLGHDHRGDPASALLEVLDPQQNNTFNDHYLEVDYDLSNVMFITTANISDTIPGPLLDRMDIIRLPGYTALEKLEIAMNFLVPRQIRENGLTEELCGHKVDFRKDACEEIIGYYTREAGVRSLERTIGAVLRKIARMLVEKQKIASAGKVIKVDVKMVNKTLGARKYTREEAPEKPEVGVTTGLAWTSVGGTILPVEASSMPGKGELKLTGSLGDVMKESALIAFSFVRGSAERYQIDKEVFQKNDFHIHVPDGATPKDGPSAGVTLVTSLVSLLTGKKVRNDYAMTGEITLHGKVTAIGGVKEKTIGALRAGIREIILPEENRKDLEELPEDVMKQLKFHFVTHADEVLSMMLEDFSLEKKEENPKPAKTAKTAKTAKAVRAVRTPAKRKTSSSGKTGKKNGKKEVKK